MKKARFTFIVSYYLPNGSMVDSVRKYHSKDAVYNNLYRYKNIAQLRVIDNETNVVVYTTAGYYSILNYLSR